MADILSQKDIDELLDVVDDSKDLNPQDLIHKIKNTLEGGVFDGSISSPEVKYNLSDIQRVLLFLKELEEELEEELDQPLIGKKVFDVILFQRIFDEVLDKRIKIEKNNTSNFIACARINISGSEQFRSMHVDKTFINVVHGLMLGEKIAEIEMEADINGSRKDTLFEFMNILIHEPYFNSNNQNNQNYKLNIDYDINQYVDDYIFYDIQIQDHTLKICV